MEMPHLCHPIGPDEGRQASKSSGVGRPRSLSRNKNRRGKLFKPFGEMFITYTHCMVSNLVVRMSTRCPTLLPSQLMLFAPSVFAWLAGRSSLQIKNSQPICRDPYT